MCKNLSFPLIRSLGYVYNPKNTRERKKKKKTKETDFLMFGFNVENIKETKI